MAWLAAQPTQGLHEELDASDCGRHLLYIARERLMRATGGPPAKIIGSVQPPTDSESRQSLAASVIGQKTMRVSE